MNQVYTRFFAHGVLAGWLLVAAGLFTGNQLVAQTNDPVAQAELNKSLNKHNPQWKDFAAMQQVVQAELLATNVSLNQPNLTDWSTAMLKAYKSFLSYTQVNMQASNDMGPVLDQAYEWIKGEPVLDAPARLMVLDDMKAKQVELILKLTFN